VSSFPFRHARSHSGRAGHEAVRAADDHPAGDLQQIGSEPVEVAGARGSAHAVRFADNFPTKQLAMDMMASNTSEFEASAKASGSNLRTASRLLGSGSTRPVTKSTVFPSPNFSISCG
jgi:hypothetical protein